jgi:hypothetical protein
MYMDVHPDDGDAWAWIDNEVRSENPIHVLAIYKRLMAEGKIDEASDLWRLNASKLKKLRKLHAAPLAALNAFTRGDIAKGTLEEIAKLPEERQKQAVKEMQAKRKKKQKFTKDDVKAIRSTMSADARAQVGLPDMDLPEATPKLQGYMVLDVDEEPGLMTLEEAQKYIDETDMSSIFLVKQI